MNPEPLSYADRVIREAMLAGTNGVDCELASGAIDDMLQAWANTARQLKVATQPGRRVKAKCQCGATVEVEVGAAPEALARQAAHIGKGIDEIARLVAFAKGQPDSRPEGSRDSRDVLRLLSDEQMAMVQRWVDEAAVRAEPE